MAGSPAATHTPPLQVLLLRVPEDAVRALRAGPVGDALRVVTAPVRTALDRLVHDPPAVVVLALDAEGAGLALLARLRAVSAIGIVTVGADRPGEAVRALDLGADDHVIGLADQVELRARLRAVVRRTAPAAEPLRFSHGGHRVTIDLLQHEVRRDGRRVTLTDTERRLLEVLAARPGVLLDHGELLRRVWGEQYGTESNYLRVYIAQLRRKLGDPARAPWLIETVPSVGYRWIAPVPGTHAPA